VVFVGDGKGGDALKSFWKRLRRCKAKIAAVAMDMSPAYNDAVATHLPDATIVYDHFHVIKIFNEKLSDLRRWLYHRVDDDGTDLCFGSAFDHLDGSAEGALIRHGSISAYRDFARHTVKRAERYWIQTVASRSLVWTSCPGNR
jgi:hypothetical protein